VILHTNVEGLRVLPAGNASDKSTELLASETMHEFMIELANRYPDRVIVFDSPPLLLTTEASVLASFMGRSCSSPRRISPRSTRCRRRWSRSARTRWSA
jgi:protein-tyrosine kinase